jgi:hypothetical protein
MRYHGHFAILIRHCFSFAPQLARHFPSMFMPVLLGSIPIVAHFAGAFCPPQSLGVMPGNL